MTIIRPHPRVAGMWRYLPVLEDQTTGLATAGTGATGSTARQAAGPPRRPCGVCARGRDCQERSSTIGPPNGRTSTTTIGLTAPLAAGHLTSSHGRRPAQLSPRVNDLRQLHISLPAGYLTNATLPSRVSAPSMTPGRVTHWQASETRSCASRSLSRLPARSHFSNAQC